jgi:DNA-binding transcriptional MerR regulator
MRTVGDVSEITGVTVRTLHHYDEIGLLRPSGRSDAGYRLYAYAASGDPRLAGAGLLAE